MHTRASSSNVKLATRKTSKLHSTKSQTQAKHRKHKPSRVPIHTQSSRPFFKSVLRKLASPTAPRSAFDLPLIDIEETTRTQHIDFQYSPHHHAPPAFSPHSSPQSAYNTHQTTTISAMDLQSKAKSRDLSPSLPETAQNSSKIHFTHNYSTKTDEACGCPNDHGDKASHNRNSTSHSSQPYQTQPTSPQPAKPAQTRAFRKFTPLESELTMLLCSVRHPDTQQDLIQGDFVTQIKETQPGHLLIRIKLDKNFRFLKSKIEETIREKYSLGEHPGNADGLDNPRNASNPHDIAAAANKSLKHINSLKITLADSQDDLGSLDPVRNAPQLPLTTQTTANKPTSPKFTTTSQNNSKSPQTSQTTTQTQVSTATSLKVSSEFDSSATLSSANSGRGSGQRGLSQVKRVIFVYSAKGGVGKSSIAANLAVALSETPYIPSDGDNSEGEHGDGGNDAQLHGNQRTQRNLRVGVFDADIYGPSLPSIIDTVSLQQGVLRGDGMEITAENTSKSIDLVEDFQDSTSAMIRPIQAHGVKMMSYGYVTRTKGGHGSGDAGPAPAIMRGGMVSPYLTELLTRTNWGSLDALIIDMPPGTSDIHITLTQQVRNASAVIVTTPNKLAFVDVVRGLQLLDQTNIPVISLVQNMSYFVAPDDKSKKKHYIFGKGDTFKQKLRTLGSIPTAIEMPIIPTIAENADVGLPLAMQYLRDLRTFVSQTSPRTSPTSAFSEPHGELDGVDINTQIGRDDDDDSNEKLMIQSTLKNFAQLAHDVYHWSSPAIRSTISRPEMSLEYINDSIKNLKKIIIKTSKEKPGIVNPDAQFTLDPFEVRANCVCAACIHEFTGTQLSDRAKIDKNVHPVAVQPRGAYAVAIQWSDGHSGSIYTWEQLQKLPRI